MTDERFTKKRSRLTLPDRVRDSLLRDLFSDVYLVGDQLPNEDELAARFDVSRATIREAIRGLVEAGYLVRRHGTGTFVTATSRQRHTLNANLSYTAMIRQAGLKPGRRLLRKLIRPATADEAGSLGIAAADPLVYVERIRTADDKPVVYSADRIPAAILGDAVEAVGDGSLYELLEDLGAPVRSAFATLRPIVAGARLARLLEVRVGSPLQQIEQVDFDELGRPVMLSSEWHLPDVFELCVSRRNDAPDP
ncbi:MAG: GntR family transcriptional regulator [Acidimicrobiales bacterium]